MSRSGRLITRRAFLYSGATLASAAAIGTFLASEGVRFPGYEHFRHPRRRFLLYSRPLRRLLEPRWEGCRAGWSKYAGNPVLGGSLGTCFDMCVLREQGRFRMWFSWRPRRSIALTESRDGIAWSAPTVVLRPDYSWALQVDRPSVLKTDRGYEMWYTGQTRRRSFIGHAMSQDGLEWTRTSRSPVVVPDQVWEGTSVMCPSVTWDAGTQTYRMWYSAGQQYEPVAIGYSTSSNGRDWTKRPGPVFTHGREGEFDDRRVGGCDVLEWGGWHLMFYIGYSAVTDAAIGLARSRDGITGWQRHPANPIIGPGPSLTGWDSGSVYKPSVVIDGDRWMLWYNGCRLYLEQIGLAVHEGLDLGFRSPRPLTQPS